LSKSRATVIYNKEWNQYNTSRTSFSQSSMWFTSSLYQSFATKHGHVQNLEW
jgi:hypothetical protein